MIGSIHVKRTFIVIPSKVSYSISRKKIFMDMHRQEGILPVFPLGAPLFTLKHDYQFRIKKYQKYNILKKNMGSDRPVFLTFF